MSEISTVTIHSRGDRDLMKAMNRNLLLNILRRERELSRTRLTEISGLSVGAVSGLINELIAEAWIFEAGAGEYTGGRRQVQLRLNPDAGYAIGLKLMENRVVGAVTDFGARVLTYNDVPFAPSIRSPEQVSRTIVEFIHTLRTTSAAYRRSERIFGIGIGLAGVIYSAEGIVHHSPFFGWRDVPLTQLIQSQIHLPISLENDVNTLTLSEQLFGMGRYHSNFIVMTIGRGVGMGIVAQGQLYRGARGGAGEFGHIVLQTTGQNGSMETHTLEAIAADPAVVLAYQQHTTGKATWTIADITHAAEAGDALARTLLSASGTALGIGLASVVNLLSPELIIVSGEGVVAGEFRLAPMRIALQQHTFVGLQNQVEVKVVPTNDEAWARGAASLVLSKVFASPLGEGVTRSASTL